MNLIPMAISRKVAAQALVVRKNSPTLLFGAGVVSMVGSTVLACRATLKLEEVLDSIEADKHKADQVKTLVDNGELPDDTTYTDKEYKNDLVTIGVRGVFSVAKLYAPSVVMGGVGILCLTKSHQILMERNAALTAAYIAVDKAFRNYRERVIDRFGEDTDRELRYDYTEVDIVDEETGKVVSTVQVPEGDHNMYARWFDSTNRNWNSIPFDENNWLFLRSQQQWANDRLRARGHMFLNEVYDMVGLEHTTAGAIVGWVYDRDNQIGDNFIDFGCWDQHDQADRFFNGRDGAILLDFNVDGPIYQLMDERNGTKP